MQAMVQVTAQDLNRVPSVASVALSAATVAVSVVAAPQIAVVGWTTLLRMRGWILMFYQMWTSCFAVGQRFPRELGVGWEQCGHRTNSK
jgi:hypothetical protein